LLLCSAIAGLSNLAEHGFIDFKAALDCIREILLQESFWNLKLFRWTLKRADKSLSDFGVFQIRLVTEKKITNPSLSAK